MSDDIIPLEITDELDLHTFSPKDVKFLVPDYLQLCREKNILQVRVIHGKGKGSMLRTVHAILGRLEYVSHFKLAEEHRGSWGATIVDLKPEKKSQKP